MFCAADLTNRETMMLVFPSILSAAHDCDSARNQHFRQHPEQKPDTKEHLGRDADTWHILRHIDVTYNHGRGLVPYQAAITALKTVFGIQDQAAKKRIHQASEIFFRYEHWQDGREFVRLVKASKVAFGLHLNEVVPNIHLRITSFRSHKGRHADAYAGTIVACQPKKPRPRRRSNKKATLPVTLGQPAQPTGIPQASVTSTPQTSPAEVLHATNKATLVLDEKRPVPIPITRPILAERSSFSPRSQREYERRLRVRVQSSYILLARPHDPGAPLPPGTWVENDRLIKRGGNTYTAHPDLLKRVAKGSTHRVNKGLRHIWRSADKSSSPGPRTQYSRSHQPVSSSQAVYGTSHPPKFQPDYIKAGRSPLTHQLVLHPLCKRSYAPYQVWVEYNPLEAARQRSLCTQNKAVRHSQKSESLLAFSELGKMLGIDVSVKKA